MRADAVDQVSSAPSSISDTSAAIAERSDRVSVIETLKGHPLFAHITLTRSERSAIAALVSEMLDGAELT